ncbi:uncharacterized protein LOC121052711 isoform X1 [Rosa chinensis]|uniref:uncharacterized protein LOC121052711 isoform X1 n=1 Tax=Rosa chinensis TaxID=74649 RepID=UPI001AD93B91|nr:uncharacterized protein LOC121052711 isoform X1 [Rosa chinensis]
MRSVKFRNLEFWKGGVAGSVKLISRKGIRMVNGCGMQLGRNWFPSWRRRDGIVETDCLEATLDLKNPKWDLLLYAAIIADIRAILQSKPELQICFAPRTCNSTQVG